MIEHSDDLARLTAIDHTIEARVDQLVESYRHNPPAYLEPLGPYPADENAVWVWNDVARTVERYRHQHHITDIHNPVGAVDHNDWQQQHVLEQLAYASPHRNVDRGIELPGLEVEL